MVLLVNACVRGESRTRHLAEKLLEKIGGDRVEVRLEDVAFPKTDEGFLKKRDSLIATRQFGDDYFSLAKQRELERKKAEEDRMAAEVARAKHEEYLRALHETSYSYGDEDDGPFHHGEGSCR